MPEPGQLALGVLARLRLAFTHGLFEGELARERLNGLLVADRLKSFGLRRVAGIEESPGLFEEPAMKHGSGALVEAPAEESSLRGKAKLENGETFQAVARRRLNGGCGLAGQQRHF